MKSSLMKQADIDRFNSLMADETIQALANDVALYFERVKESGMTPNQAYNLTYQMQDWLLSVAFSGHDREYED